MAVKKEKLTPWFPAGVRPMRNGFYLRDYRPTIAYSYWDGECWSMGCFDINDHKFTKSEPSAFQGLRWRGLAEQPK